MASFQGLFSSTRRKKGERAPTPLATSLAQRCAVVLGDCLAGMADDVGDWGETVASWPAPALKRVLPQLPGAALLRLRAAYPDSPLARALDDGDALDVALRAEAITKQGSQLLDVFAGDAAGAAWRLGPWSADVAAAQVLFHQPPRFWPDGADAACAGLAQFRDAFDVFGSGLLRGVDLKALGLVAAGGGVLACVEARPPGREAGPGLVEWFEARSHAAMAGRSRVEAAARTLQRRNAASPSCTSSDVDLFLVGLDERAAMDALVAVHAAVVRNACARVACVRSASAITFSAGFPRRNVQVVLRLYASAAAVLDSFDVDACCFAYDGERVWGAPRGVRALCEKLCRVDAARRSLTYEARLVKYALRGYAVYVPPSLYRPAAVDPRVFDLPLAVRDADPRRGAAAGAAKPQSGLVRLLIASRLFSLRRTKDEELNRMEEKPGSVARRRPGAPAPTRSLRDVFLKGFMYYYSRTRSPPMLPDEPKTYYSSYGPARVEADYVAEDEAARAHRRDAQRTREPLYRCAVPWKPGWDAARILSFIRAKEAALIADEDEDGWRPPTVRVVAERSSTLPSEDVLKAAFDVTDLVHASALRWQSPSRSFYPVAIEGFGDGAHLRPGDPRVFYRATVSTVGHVFDDAKERAKTRHWERYRRPGVVLQAMQAHYDDWAALGLLPSSGAVAAHHSKDVFEARVVVRESLDKDEVGSVEVLRRFVLLMRDDPSGLLRGLEPGGEGPQPVPSPAMNDVEPFQNLPAAKRTLVAAALNKRYRAIIAYVLKDRVANGRDHKAAHAELLKAHPSYDARNTWSEQHRSLSLRCARDYCATLDDDARRALVVPVLDAYLALEVAFAPLEVAIDVDASCVGVCARCAVVLTKARKCARCKAVHYCSRDCQTEHWATHRAKCVAADKSEKAS